MADKPDISLVDNRSIEDGDRPDKQSASRVIANIHVLGLNDDDAEFYETFPPERRSKLVSKVVSGSGLSGFPLGEMSCSIEC